MVYQLMRREPHIAESQLKQLCRGAILATTFCNDSSYRFHPRAYNCRYPIYRIPTGPTLKDLDACFLTFHYLATPFKGIDPSTPVCPSFGGINHCVNAAGKLTLPVFGLAPYKLRSSIWSSDRPEQQQLATSMMQAADDWLRNRQVHHPDFRFFLNHYNTVWR